MRVPPTARADMIKKMSPGNQPNMKPDTDNGTLYFAAIAIAAMALASSIGAAHADSYTLTVTGTMYDGGDNAGIFGAPGTPFSGLYGGSYPAYTANYAIDNGSVIGATLTITGQTYNFQPSYYSELKLSSKQLYVDIDSAYCDQYTCGDHMSFNIYNDVANIYVAPMFPVTLTPFSYTYGSRLGDEAQGYFRIDGCAGACGDFTINTITLADAPVASVPGPVVGAGLPGLMTFAMLLLARYRKRRFA